ncbi:PREDICTED: kelch-like protein 7, partial [Nanorana parkeri]|uniref:kelch-like protein 7 n=1 Tax=Nanorana parkeri TaxID=125878 RepID=UPI000854C224
NLRRDFLCLVREACAVLLIVYNTDTDTRLRNVRHTMEKSSKQPSRYIDEDTEAFLEDHDTMECHIIKGLRELYITEALCDATIITESGRFPCHRVVLASVSPYFRAMFTSSMLESEHGEVCLLDVSSSVIQSILHFIYSGEAALSLDSVEDLFTASGRLQITAMQEVCGSFLINKLTNDNCFWVYRLARSHNHIRLQGVAIQYICWNITRLYDKEDFLHLEQDELRSVLSSDQLMVSSELCIFRMALRWWKANGAAGSPFPVELCRVIRFPLMSPRELEEVKRDESLELSGPQGSTTFRLRQGMFENRIVCMDLQAREDHTLDDNDFFLDCYDPVSDHWDKLAPLKSLMYPGCLAVENYLYVTGGMNQDDAVSRTFHVFDSLTNTWTEFPSMRSPRSLHGFLSYKKKLFAVGGWNGGDVMDSMECFDLSKNCWSESPKLPFPLCAFASTQLKGKLYVIGGETGRERLFSEKGLLIYDTSSHLWSHIPNKIVVAFGGAVTLDNKVFVIGGCDNYCPSTGQAVATSTCLCLDERGWVSQELKVPPLPEKLASAGVVRWQQRIYIYSKCYKSRKCELRMRPPQEALRPPRFSEGIALGRHRDPEEAEEAQICFTSFLCWLLKPENVPSDTGRDLHQTELVRVAMESFYKSLLPLRLRGAVEFDNHTRHCACAAIGSYNLR